MIDSLFLSPTFILTEASFIIAASIAAYELIIGDFIWAQQEEARRTSMQSHRGRGYDSFETGQHPHGHRSLSPGGRGRGPPRHGPSSRRGSNEDSYLLYPPRSRGGETRIAEEGYYSSPGDTRFASPGRGSSGDSTRRLFYKVILLALLSRFILLPVETFFFTPTFTSYEDQTVLSHFTINSAHLQIILLRISQTFPDIIFASALGSLIIFCAQIAFAAMPPLTPQSGEGSIHGEDDATTLEDGMTERDGLLGEGGIKGQEIIMEGDDATNRSKGNSKIARTLCIAAARLSRTLLASKKTFVVWNIILSSSYTAVFVAALIVPTLSVSEISLWMVMAVIYSFLLLAFCYVALLLGKALHPGIVRRKNADSLTLRLVGMCTLLAFMLINRVVWFVMVANRSIIDLNGTNQEEQRPNSYRRSTIEYLISEPLPVLFILYMMHRKRKEVQNDVLIIHSIMNNLFGSSSQLDTTNAPPASGDGTGIAVTRGGGLQGSRRFQTYGGTRGDSFPPTSSGTRRNMPRATSSSGGGRPKPQQQQPPGT
ncbi:hypothetical protein ACHAXR_008137 [Thalassiosira sp. AJA248-18]